MMDAEARARELAGIVAEELLADEWRAIVRAAIDQAKEGDAKARTWLTEQIALTPEELAALLESARNSGLDTLMGAWKKIDEMTPEEYAQAEREAEERIAAGA